jgi:hypothetical protein
MKISKLWLIMLLLFVKGVVYSQSDGIIERKFIDPDSSRLNLKISGGIILFTAVDPYKSRGAITFSHGYSIGLVLSLSEICELEGSFTFGKSNSGANTNGVISNFGLRINLYRSDLNVYTGFGAAIVSAEETRNCGPYGCGPMGDPAIRYYSLTIPLGLTYKLSESIVIDLNSRLSIIPSELQVDRIMHSLGIILDI